MAAVYCGHYTARCVATTFESLDVDGGHTCHSEFGVSPSWSEMSRYPKAAPHMDRPPGFPQPPLIRGLPRAMRTNAKQSNAKQ